MRLLRVRTVRGLYGDYLACSGIIFNAARWQELQRKLNTQAYRNRERFQQRLVDTNWDRVSKCGLGLRPRDLFGVSYEYRILECQLSGVDYVIWYRSAPIRTSRIIKLLRFYRLASNTELASIAEEINDALAARVELAISSELAQEALNRVSYNFASSFNLSTQMTQSAKLSTEESIKVLKDVFKDRLKCLK